MKKPKGKAVAAFTAAVIGAGVVAGAVVEFVPPFNGSQPMSVWQQKAEQAVKDDAKAHHILPLIGDITPVAATPSGDKSFRDSKILDLNVSDAFGFVSVPVQVKCDQPRVDGFRGGDITCTVLTPPANHYRIAR